MLDSQGEKIWCIWMQTEPWWVTNDENQRVRAHSLISYCSWVKLFNYSQLTASTAHLSSPEACRLFHWSGLFSLSLSCISLMFSLLTLRSIPYLISSVMTCLPYYPCSIITLDPHCIRNCPYLTRLWAYFFLAMLKVVLIQESLSDSLGSTLKYFWISCYIL